MDRLNVINERQTKVLECLARYTYLTVYHLQKLGIAPQPRNIRDRYLRPLTEGRSPLVGIGQFHVNNKRLPWVYYLTEHGAKAVAQLQEVPLDEIYYPKGKTQFTRDYQHRMETIDCMITLEQWAHSKGYEIEFWDTYFQVEGSQKKSSAPLKKRTEVILGDDKIEPDVNLGILIENTSKLFTLELHRQPKTQRIVQQLAQHAHFLRHEALSDKYNHPNLNYVLSIHHSYKAMQAVQKELSTSKHLEHVEECFLFSDYKTLTRNITTAWVDSKGKPNSLFSL